MGAILLYLAIGLAFVSLFTLLGLLIPDAFTGMSITDTPSFTSTMIYFVWDLDRSRVRQHCAFASDRAQSHGCSCDDRAALSCYIVG